jgi:hypothetical protein
MFTWLTEVDSDGFSDMHRLSLNHSSLDSAKTPNTAEIMRFSVSKFNASATPNLSVGGAGSAGSGGRAHGPTPDSMGLSGSRGRGSADSSLLKLSSSASRNMSMGGGVSTGLQGSTLRTVRLPGATKSGCRASIFPCKLARRTTKYFALLLLFTTLDK